MLEYAMCMSAVTSLQFIYSPAAATAVVKRMRICSSFIRVKMLMNVVTVLMLEVIFDFSVVVFNLDSLSFHFMRSVESVDEMCELSECRRSLLI